MPRWPQQTLKQRFDAKWKLDESTGCWMWQSYRGKHRYGIFNHTTGHNQRAHRVAWQIYRGDIPSGLHVLHKCDTPACVNPEHLFLGTQKENIADALAKGRGVGRRKPKN